MQQAIDFEWTKCRAGYRQIAPKQRQGSSKWKCSEKPGIGIEAASRSVDRYRPLDVLELFAIFADAKHTVEGMIDFCNKFGMLEHKQEAGGTFSITLDRLLDPHADMRGAVGLLKRGERAALAERVNAGLQFAQWPGHVRYAPAAVARLDLGADGRMRVALVPPNLLSAMWLQLAFHAASDAKLLRCEQCQRPFVIGTGTGRRNTAKYCSRACNMGAFKARQAE
jgi:hypothetical protein